MLILTQPSEVKVNQEGIYVVLVHEGHRIELPWRAAKRLQIALKIQANRAEEIEKAHQIVEDNALLLRRGVAFLGLSNNPDIKKETMKEAAHNTKLRKYIPHVSEGIRSREVVGTPTLIKHKENNG